jgi:DNA adenine methylase
MPKSSSFEVPLKPDPNKIRDVPLISTLAGEFILTYVNDCHIRDLAHHYGFAVQPIPMRTTHHVETEELLLSRIFDWIGGK